MRTSRFLAASMTLATLACQAKTDSRPRAEAASGGPIAAVSVSTVGAAPLAPTLPPPAVLPAGTVLPVALESALSSATSREGERIVGRVTEDVRVGGRVVLERGAEVRGQVRAAEASGRVKGRARLSFVFNRLVVNGKEHELEARGTDITAASAKKRDVAMIGGGTAGGAIIGAIADGKKGAAIGGLIGGAAGTGAALATKGKEVRLPAGSSVRVKLEREVRL